MKEKINPQISLFEFCEYFKLWHDTALRESAKSGHKHLQINRVAIQVIYPLNFDLLNFILTLLFLL